MRVLLYSIIILVMFGPLATQAGSIPDEIVLETNKARANEGLSLLAPDDALMIAAQARAEDMARTGHFAHHGADGSSPWQWVTDQGYTFSRAAENLAVNYRDAESVVAGWLSSPGHRANLLDARLTDIGVGVAEGMYKGERAHFVVQFLMKPADGTFAQAAAVVQTSVEVVIEPGKEAKNSPQSVAAAPDVAALMAQLQSLLTMLRGLFGT
jgi:hypothetical protein